MIVKPCIVVGCDWKQELPAPPKSVGDALKDRILQTEYHSKLETELELHLAGHSLVEWAQTVMLWRSRAEAASEKLLKMQRTEQRVRDLVDASDVETVNSLCHKIRIALSS